MSLPLLLKNFKYWKHFVSFLKLNAMPYLWTHPYDAIFLILTCAAYSDVTSGKYYIDKLSSSKAGSDKIYKRIQDIYLNAGK